MGHAISWSSRLGTTNCERRMHKQLKTKLHKCTKTRGHAFGDFPPTGEIPCIREAAELDAWELMMKKGSTAPAQRLADAYYKEAMAYIRDEFHVEDHRAAMDARRGILDMVVKFEQCRTTE